ncbi:hypothetical protein BD310DRAFT_102638 [Dichomitus squalens]|uniref:Uncharacterized protein n=1 Tax=Dichomitus squalens TaxID=114155 RepID=A0A4V2K6Z1_9APHY|nr:hypothetical protein BD310DRAFT_102638 [Dichomitus squalens]
MASPVARILSHRLTHRQSAAGPRERSDANAMLSALSSPHTPRIHSLPFTLLCTSARTGCPSVPLHPLAHAHAPSPAALPAALRSLRYMSAMHNSDPQTRLLRFFPRLPWAYSHLAGFERSCRRGVRADNNSARRPGLEWASRQNIRGLRLVKSCLGRPALE